MVFCSLDCGSIGDTLKLFEILQNSLIIGMVLNGKCSISYFFLWVS